MTKTLGAGAMGEVYEAIDDVLGREVAIKTLRGASGMAARFIDERFRNEARAIAQLAHPGVVQVFDIDLTAEPPFLVMERVAGPALSTRLDAGPLPVEEVVPLGIQIARALAAAHAVNVVHRDVKPSNILGAGAASWKLADFGVAHVPDSSLTMTGQFVGSPAYAPPEALIKGISNAAGDVYGLGATLYEAASGSWPRIEAMGALLAPVPPLAERAPQVPPHVAAAIDRAVSLEADKRPTAAELAELLAGTSTSGHALPMTPVPMPAAPRPMPVTPRGPLRWQPWAIAGALVLVVVIAIAMRGDKPKGFAPVMPDKINVGMPQGMDRKMAKDWSKVIGALQDRDFAGARDRLEDWESRYGATPETQALRDQLDRLPPEVFDRGDDNHKKHKQ